MAKVMENEQGIAELALTLISPDPKQPRRHFNEQGIAELAASLKSNGLLQPITVRPDGEGYILIAGERRYRAAVSLGWPSITAIVRYTLSNAQASKLQLLENIVRKDLLPMEEVYAYQRLIEEGMTVKEVAESVGRGTSTISWYLALLRCIEPVQHLVNIKQLLPTVAHAMSNLSPNGQMAILRKLNSDLLSTEEALALIGTAAEKEMQSDMLPAYLVSAKSKSLNRRRKAITTRLALAVSDLHELLTENGLADSIAQDTSVLLEWCSAGKLELTRLEALLSEQMPQPKGMAL